MSKEKTTQASGGIGLCTILTALFVASKIFQVGICKDWSWWWVFSPVWIPLGIAAAIFLVIGFIWVVAKALS